MSRNDPISSLQTNRISSENKTVRRAEITSNPALNTPAAPLGRDAARVKGLEIGMKKYLIALAAVAAMTGSASAADLGARPYTKAPVAVAPVANWTGLWISGGFGYGLAQYQHSENDAAAPFALISTGQQASRGGLGKSALDTT